jgi:hypothetical protein
MSDKATVGINELRLAWSLINSREWPFSMMSDLAQVRVAFEKAVEEQTPNESKSSDSN